jgi:Tfp pilus assembly protein PilN
MLTKHNSCLRSSRNIPNLVHCVAWGYGKMQIINSSAFRERIAEIIAWLLPVHRSYDDLASKPWTELAVDTGRIRLFRKSIPKSTLAKATLVADGPDPFSVAHKLRQNEKVLVSVNSVLCLEMSELVPNVSTRKTGAILGFSNLRTLPMRKEDYVWGWFQEDQNQMQQRCKKVVLRKDILAPALAAIEKSGAKCIGLIFRHNNSSAYPIALAPEGQAYNSSRFTRWSKGFAFSFCGLSLAIGVLLSSAALRQSSEATLISENIARLTSEVKAFKDKLATDHANQQVGTDLRNRKLGEVSKRQLLSEISSLLPDRAYVSNLLIEQKTLTIDGAAEDPEALVAQLEASKLFVKVSFTGPVMRNPGETKSHFSLRIDLATSNAKAAQ